MEKISSHSNSLRGVEAKTGRSKEGIKFIVPIVFAVLLALCIGFTLVVIAGKMQWDRNSLIHPEQAQFFAPWAPFFNRIFMDILLAIDIMGGFVVQGQSGNRESYRPLDWGLVPDATPAAYTAAMKPVYGYVADLDGVEQTGHDNEEGVRACCNILKKSYVNRGHRAFTVSEEDRQAGIFPVISTETGGNKLGAYHGGALTVDLKADRIYPTGESPAAFLRNANAWDYDVCIIINLGSVGTEQGLPPYLAEMRSAYEGTLFYGGGLASEKDCVTVSEEGYDGALVATAVHRGAIPLDAVQRGYIP